ncbi:hypothetical protein [Lactobacillus delbrueckii]|uniref:hypothetical protein n=1 Tax=Lactobacillus delbrueckii TaxID=1584 RepID=UPI001F43A07E|nr:hypothetical protein [Lactobacillus delbrueckii]GHN50806.1 hypothetical protein ME801_04750 [Lactobacillus delbrueckii]
MRVNLNDWDELASYFDAVTTPRMIYKDYQLLGFGLRADDFMLCLDEHGGWHIEGCPALELEAINLMQKIADDNIEDRKLK